MFESIKNKVTERLGSSKSAEDEERVMHYAAAALLLEVSRADFDIQDEELAIITQALKNRFNFSDDEVKDIVDTSLNEHDKHISIYPFVKIINDGCSHEEKKLLLQDLWSVAFADDRLDKYEDYQIRKIADLLYLSHSEFIQTKLAVQERE